MPESIDQRLSRISSAWSDLFPGDEIDSWVMETYDTYVIATIDGNYYRVPYADDGESVMFGAREQWAAVERTYVMKAAVKALADDEEWALDVLVPYYGPFNGKDMQGQFFSPRTKFYEELYPTPPATYYHGGVIGGPRQPEPLILGKSLSFRDTDEGRWYRVVLDKTQEWARKVWEAAKVGKAAASPGGGIFGYRYKPNGEITHWPLIELTLLDMREGHNPINPYAVAVPAMKAVYEQAGIEWPDVEIGDVSGAEAGDLKAETQEIGASETSGAVETTIKAMEDNMSEQNKTTTLSPEVAALVTQSVADALKADREAQEAAREAEERQQELIAEAVKAERAKWEEEVKASRRLPFSADNAPTMTQFGAVKAYENLTGPETALAIALLKANNLPVKQGLYQSAALKATQDDSPYAEMDAYGGVEDERLMLKAQGWSQDKVENAIKANEAVYSTSTGYGDEWVTVQYSRDLWMKIRQANPVLERMNQTAVVVPQGTESIQFHLESTDPVWYVVAQATATGANGPEATVTSSRIATGNQSLTVKKMGARVPFTGEAEEDIIIALVPQIERQIAESGANYLTSAIIDGDTNTSSAGINDAAGTAGSTDWHTAMDGFRKLALVTNSDNARDAGALTVEDYLETLWLMGAGGKNAFVNPKMTSFIQDPNVNKVALQLPEVKTKDVSTQATIEDGLLTSIWGREVITSYNMHFASLANSGYEYKTEATGYIDIDTASDNTKGALLAVRWDQWKLGYKRRITMERQRWAYADLTEIVAMMRVGSAYRDTEACAESYNITV